MGKVQKAILATACHPAQPLQALGIAGFEEGLDMLIPAYNIGMYLAADKIAPLLHSLQSQRKEWVSLCRTCTGYPEPWIRPSLQMMEEAFLWAISENCALVEVDELGGVLGFR